MKEYMSFAELRNIAYEVNDQLASVDITSVDYDGYIMVWTWSFIEDSFRLARSKAEVVFLILDDVHQLTVTDDYADELNEFDRMNIARKLKTYVRNNFERKLWKDYPVMGANRRAEKKEQVISGLTSMIDGVYTFIWFAAAIVVALFISDMSGWTAVFYFGICIASVAYGLYCLSQLGKKAASRANR